MYDSMYTAGLPAIVSSLTIGVVVEIDWRATTCLSFICTKVMLPADLTLVATSTVTEEPGCAMIPVEPSAYGALVQPQSDGNVNE